LSNPLFTLTTNSVTGSAFLGLSPTTQPESLPIAVAPQANTDAQVLASDADLRSASSQES
ncbi:MAG: hypothetical protein AAGE92_10645, partial [Cyanobacteria bacterium P01_G01_bin.4]